MKRNRLHFRLAKNIPAAALALVLLCPAAAVAQDRGFLDNMFNRGDDQPPPSRDAPRGGDSSDMSVRIDRVEAALRQLTGTVEQLQYQNQQLQMQLKRMQDDANYRQPQMGPGGGGPPPSGPNYVPPPQQQQQMAPQQMAPGRRSDAFDPSRNPNAPVLPRTLGNESIAAPEPDVANAPPVGAPGGRDAGAPLDLSSLSGDGGSRPPGGMSQPPMQPMQQGSQLPPPPPRNTSATGGQQLATLPPTARPQDEYDLAYGYVLHKDYGLAEQAFRDFLRKYPDERLVPDAQYWMGESLYQQQRYRDAAESFLAVSTKYDHSGKAPDSLLRLGQSLAALNKKEAACATLAEVGRKYPRVSASVKRTVTQEQKRVHC